MFRIEAVKHFSGSAPDERPKANVNSLPYLEYLNKLKNLEQTLRGNGQWFLPHPWLTTFVPRQRCNVLRSRLLGLVQ